MVVPSVTPPTALSNESALSVNKTIDAKSDSSKARHRQQAAMMEAWLELNSNNLYPTREQKDRLAADMQMSYMQVSRSVDWFPVFCVAFFCAVLFVGDVFESSFVGGRRR